MRNTLRARLFPLAACSLLVCAPPAPAAEEDRDQYEGKFVARATERAVRVAKNDRVQWVKELEAAFPNRVGNPVKEEEYGAWFKLVAGNADVWRRADAPKPLAELFDRAIQKLELGPVPSITRDEFMRYARRVLAQGNQGNSDPHEDPDRVFRVLDRDGDGNLGPDELTTKLREERVRADADANGRIDKNEYRDYFQRRVAAAAALASDAKPGDPKAAASGVPGWFADLDADKDGQIALHEWRKAGRAIDAFMKMDLDADGLLTKEEYARFLKMTEAAAPPAPKP